MSDVTASDLTHFRLAQLVVLADIETDPKRTPYGLAIKRGLEDYYGEDINHGRLYPNLDAHVDDGLVDKRELDRRTNEYTLTDAGRDVLESHVTHLASSIDKVLVDPDHRLANAEPATIETDGGKR